jgi:uncharacterized protein with GYD domain
MTTAERTGGALKPCLSWRKEGNFMSLYVMFTNLTDEGRKTIKENPERIRAVNKEVEAMGVKILAQYVLLGSYDFLNVLEAPDNKAVARVAVELGSRGTLSSATFGALSVNEFVEMFKKP